LGYKGAVLALAGEDITTTSETLAVDCPAPNNPRNVKERVKLRKEQIRVNEQGTTLEKAKPNQGT